MKQATGRFFRKSALWVSRRYLAWPPLARRTRPVLARHRAWVHAVLRKFALRSARSGTQSLIFQRSVRKGPVTIHKFKKVCLTIPGRLQQVLRIHTATIEHTIGEHTGSGALRTALSSIPYQTRKSRGPLQLLSRPAPANRHAQQRTVESATPALKAEPMTRFQERRLAGTRRARETNQLREKVTIHRAERYEQISEMIVRKTQRVEDRAFASRYGARQTVILAPEKSTNSRPPQRSEKQTTREPAKASAPGGSVVNVAGLTDEVMRQLDRRLVAAMERLGKT